MTCKHGRERCLECAEVDELKARIAELEEDILDLKRNGTDKSARMRHKKDKAIINAQKKRIAELEEREAYLVCDNDRLQANHADDGDRIAELEANLVAAQENDANNVRVYSERIEELEAALTDAANLIDHNASKHRTGSSSSYHRRVLAGEKRTADECSTDAEGKV